MTAAILATPPAEAFAAIGLESGYRMIKDALPAFDSWISAYQAAQPGLSDFEAIEVFSGCLRRFLAAGDPLSGAISVVRFLIHVLVGLLPSTRTFADQWREIRLMILPDADASALGLDLAHLDALP